VLSKIATFMGLLQAGRVLVNLDARRPGVVLPAHLLGDKCMTLEYGRNLPTPIVDLEIDEFGIRAGLSFDGKISMTWVPWSAVFRIADRDDNGGFWAEDMPDDLQFERPVERTRRQGWSN